MQIPRDGLVDGEIYLNNTTCMFPKKNAIVTYAENCANGHGKCCCEIIFAFSIMLFTLTENNTEAPRVNERFADRTQILGADLHLEICNVFLPHYH